MSNVITVPAGEAATIRVFAVNRPVDTIRADLAHMPVSDLARDLLGDPHLNTASTEIFPAADLAGVGLASYLSEGYAVSENDLTPDRAKLDALEGYILLLFSDSFAGAAATLKPGSDVALIGSYAEFRPGYSSGSLTADSAMPYTGVPGVVPMAPAKGAAGSIMVVIAIAILIVLGLWWLLT
ncbi:hypothetical protein [uncultured Roseobacter sp.]|uniref:hypothetical protein n=1 Tax=uncultured Roseobacter sp. TaxID=114847 RepID=UPI0026283EC7|nr:hypothetical protein [uncultured Roseobacter sp.]